MIFGLQSFVLPRACLRILTLKWASVILSLVLYECETWSPILREEYRPGMLDNRKYEGWNFNSGNYLFTTDTK